MKRDFVPQRTCAACRKKQNKGEMLRIAKSADKYYIDIGGKSDGRGVYICYSPECAAALKKKKGLHRAFKGAVDETLYDEVIAAVKKICEEKTIEQS